MSDNAWTNADTCLPDERRMVLVAVAETYHLLMMVDGVWLENGKPYWNETDGESAMYWQYLPEAP